MEKVKVLEVQIQKWRGGGNWCTRFIYLVLLVIAVYFLWMDVWLYFHIQARKPGNAEAAIEKDHSTAFAGLLTVKLIMSDPANNYINVPSTEIFNKVTHFTSVFPFITANVISVTHTILAVVASKFLSLDSLSMRRVGVALFEFRTWLDALDGLVFRAHAKQHTYISQRFTFGYYIDAVADIVGCTGLCFAMMFYLRRNVPKRYVELLPWRSPLSLTQDAAAQATVPTKKTVVVKCVSLGILFALASGTWDSYVASYHELLEAPTSIPEQAALQLSILQSTMCWMIMWSWRILNAHSFMEMALVSVFIDKIWEFLNLVQYVGYILLIILIITTQIHIQYVTSALSQFGQTTMAAS